VIGDTVNFAARLNRLNKELNSQLLTLPGTRCAGQRCGRERVSLATVASKGI